MKSENREGTQKKDSEQTGGKEGLRGGEEEKSEDAGNTQVKGCKSIGH